MHASQSGINCLAHLSTCVPVLVFISAGTVCVCMCACRYADMCE